MKSVLVAVVVFLLFGSAAMAFEVTDVERCKAILADGPRLACFDAVTADVSRTEVSDEESEPSSSSSGDTGAWQITVDLDPITDEKVVTAALESTARLSSSRPPVLFVRCKSKTPEVFISWNDFLSDETAVTARVDENEPKTTSWSPSTDQTATFAYQPADLLKSIRDAKRFSARITPYRSGPVTANFPISGLDAVLTLHEDACGVGKL